MITQSGAGPALKLQCVLLKRAREWRPAHLCCWKGYPQRWGVTAGQKSTPGSVDRSGPAREGRSPNGSSARRQSRRYRVSGARTARQQQRCAARTVARSPGKKAATFDRDSLYKSNLNWPALRLWRAFYCLLHLSLDLTRKK